MDPARGARLLSAFLALAALGWLVASVPALAQGGMKTVYIETRFRPPEQLAELVRPLLSERGRLAADDASGLLVVTDTPERLEEILAVLNRLQSGSAQFSVKATVMEASEEFLSRVGVDWEVGLAQGYARAGFGNGLTALSVRASLAELEAGVRMYQGSSASRRESVMRVTVMSGETAELASGVSIPLAVRDAAGNTVIQHRDVGLKLKVTPSMRSGGELIQINISLTAEALTGQGLIVDSSGTATTVYAAPGETVVIADLDQARTGSSSSGTPGLSDAPLLGPLFGVRGQGGERRIFVVLIQADRL